MSVRSRILPGVPLLLFPGLGPDKTVQSVRNWRNMPACARPGGELSHGLPVEIWRHLVPPPSPLRAWREDLRHLPSEHALQGFVCSALADYL